MSNYPKSLWELPKYTALELNKKHNDYCVCVFIINEGKKFHRQLERMQSLSEQVDIVVADGGSSDGSTNPDILKKYAVNTLLTKTDEGKLGAQMRMAFSWALDRKYKGVIVIDGNNKDSVEDIPCFIEKLNQGYDHIQGSRFIPGGHHKNTPLSRLIGLKLLHVPIMRIASGFKYTDTTNGFRAYSSKLLSDPKVAVFRNILSGYELHYYLAVRAPKLGYNCIEIPTTRKYPPKGKIPTKISPIRGNLQVIHRLVSTCIGRYNP